MGNPKADRRQGINYQQFVDKLLNYVKEREDEGYAGDLEAIDAWAKMLLFRRLVLV